MKKLLLLTVIALSATSCSMLMDDIIETGMTGHNEYYMDEWEELDTYLKISKYIKQNVEYTSDIVQHTQAPEETITRGKGDCEDMAILYMNIAYVSMGIKMDAVIIKWSRQVEDGGMLYNHVAVRYDGLIIDALSGWKLTNDVEYFYSYNEVFN